MAGGEGVDSEIQKMFGLVLDKLESIDSRMERLESRMNNMEARQTEIFQVAKGIEHANQVHRAELDNVTVRPNYLEGTLNEIGKVIAVRGAVK